MSARLNWSAMDRARLAKLLGRLGDDNEGEVVAAAHAIHRTAMAHGIDWSVALPPACDAARPTPIPVSPKLPWQREVMACRDVPEIFDGWERSFLKSIAAASSLSDKQRAKLAILYGKARQSFDRECAA